MVETRNVYNILVGKHEGKNHLEDFDGRISLKLISNK
jgi:hypothetical protein